MIVAKTQNMSLRVVNNIRRYGLKIGEGTGDKFKRSVRNRKLNTKFLFQLATVSIIVVILGHEQEREYENCRT